MKVSNKFLVALAVLMVGFTFYYVQYGGLFPLIEYRAWMTSPDVSGNGIPWLKNALLIDAPNETFSRNFSLAATSFNALIFGNWHWGHNAVHLLFLTFPAAVIVLTTATRPGRRAIVAGTIAAFFYLFQFSSVDAAAWQGTFLDKTSVMMTAVSLLYVFSIRTIGGSVKELVITNIALFLLYACTYGAKEAPWALAPVATMFVFVRRAFASKLPLGHSAVTGAIDALKLTGLPLLYASAYVTKHYIATVNAPGAERLFGGDISANIRNIGAYMTNEWVLDVADIVSDFAVIGLIAIGGVVAALVRPGERERACLILVALMAFVASCVIPARTTGLSPFYLLVAGFYLAMTIGLSIAALLVALSRNFSAIVSVVLIGFVAVHAQEQWTQGRPYREIAALSPNFFRSLDTLRESLKQNSPDRITVLYPSEVLRSYMYVEQGYLAQFILPRGTPPADIRALDNKIHVAAIESRSGPTPAEGELVLILDKSMGPAEILSAGSPR